MNAGGELLTHDEIVDLTGKRRHKAQLRALATMGIRHVVRPDGSPVVARALVATLLARYAETPPAAGAGDAVLNLAALRVKRRPKTPT